MILECPNCSSKFRLEPKSLEPLGKKVRCSACQHTWFQAPENGLPIAEPTEDAPQNVGDYTEFGDPQTVATAIPAAEEFKKAPEPQVIPPNPGRLWSRVALASVALIALTLAFGKTWVVGAWEPAALLYDTLGSPAAVVGEGLDFENVKVERSLVEGHPHLVVSGFLINNSGKPQDIPALKAQIRDNSQNILAEWSFKAETSRIIPIESKPFYAEIKGEFENAASVTITFDTGSQHRPKRNQEDS